MVISIIKKLFKREEEVKVVKKTNVKIGRPAKQQIHPLSKVVTGVRVQNRLKKLGITTTDKLLRAGRTTSDRVKLAKSINVDKSELLGWLNLIDLYRISGIGKDYADILGMVGVSTVVDLSTRNPENLYEKILELKKDKKFKKKIPSITLLKKWSDKAKTLARVLEY